MKQHKWSRNIDRLRLLYGLFNKVIQALETHPINIKNYPYIM